METARFSETLVSTSESMWHHNPDEKTHHMYYFWWMAIYIFHCLCFAVWPVQTGASAWDQMALCWLPTQHVCRLLHGLCCDTNRIQQSSPCNAPLRGFKEKWGAEKRLVGSGLHAPQFLFDWKAKQLQLSGPKLHAWVMHSIFILAKNFNCMHPFINLMYLHRNS